MNAPVKPRRPRSKSDAGLVQKTIDYLEMRGVWCWRANSGGYHREGVHLRLSPPGTPDVLLVLNGWLCGIECKAPGKRQNANQIKWQARAAREGVGYAVAWSIADVKAAVDGWEKEMSDHG